MRTNDFMKKRFSEHHLHVMAIVHGQSEFCICQSITSNLHLPHEIIARDKGKNSIQINGILRFLQGDSRFGKFNSFLKAFPNVEVYKKELLHFRLFIIMDTDDCDDKTREAYISGELFRNFWLYPYITPIYNTPNLEITMEKAEIPIERKKDYIKIFPTNKGDLDLQMAKDFSRSLHKSKECTNMYEYVDYCIDLAEQNCFHNEHF